jgi:hypothetical protein
VLLRDCKKLIYCIYMLHDKTIELVRADTRDLKQIAEESGIGYSWLTKFVTRQMKDPGVNKTEDLYDFLRKTGKRKRNGK